MQTMTRREAVRLLGAASAAAWLATAQTGFGFSLSLRAAAGALSDTTPPLAPGSPMSPERIALIEA